MEDTKTENSSRWQPGQSGNPAGRPRGSRNKRTAMIQELFDGEVEAVARKLIELAKAGDIAAITILLDRSLPRRRPIEIELPEVRGITDNSVAGDAVIAAVAAGEITTDEAEHLMRLLESNAKLAALYERATGRGF